jgi:hypothetical protein
VPSSHGLAECHPCGAPAPSPVATIGLHGSASTWVYNVVRELLIAARGAEQVLAVYAEKLTELPAESTRKRRQLVIKSHHGSAELDSWLVATQAQIVLSIRDPRDACISMSQRFSAPIGATVPWLTADCNRVMRLALQDRPLLRYENRFFEDQAAPQKLADYLGLRVAPSSFEDIFARYRTDAVRSFAQSLADLPPERLMMFASSHLMDRVTQIHAPHIGDSRSGKWRGLPSALQQELTRAFSAFLDRFGYPQ